MIVLLVEGATETALKGKFKAFLDERAKAEGKPKIALRTKDIMTLNPNKLCRRVYLELRRPNVTDVVGLIDVYLDFTSATEAKKFLRNAVGDESHFYAHAAQYDVEALASTLLGLYLQTCEGPTNQARCQPGGG